MIVMMITTSANSVQVCCLSIRIAYYAMQRMQSQVNFRLLHEKLERLGRPQLTQEQLRPIT